MRQQRRCGFLIRNFFALVPANRARGLAWLRICACSRALRPCKQAVRIPAAISSRATENEHDDRSRHRVERRAAGIVSTSPAEPAGVKPVAPLAGFFLLVIKRVLAHEPNFIGDPLPSTRRKAPREAQNLS